MRKVSSERCAAVSPPIFQALEDDVLENVTGGGKYGKFNSYEELKADCGTTFRNIPGLPGRVSDTETSGLFSRDRPNCGEEYGVTYVYQVNHASMASGTCNFCGWKFPSGKEITD